ncbi:MAG: S8 family peptidase [Deltaproteobacteria bacterium]|nr:S8 family peptidase [Deltaproteobacteria bacterium]
MAKKKTAGKTEKKRPKFDSKALDSSTVAVPMVEEMQRTSGSDLMPVIIDLNLLYPKGRKGARTMVRKLIKQLVAQRGDSSKGSGLDSGKNKYCPQYVFAHLSKGEIEELVRLDCQTHSGSSRGAIYKIWPDFEVEAHLTDSVSTVKADAARAAFGAAGDGQVWAVIDSGIDGTHEHFKEHENLTLKDPLSHRDFVGTGSPLKNPKDDFGHGTHVAGIIAGEIPALGQRRRQPEDTPGEEGEPVVKEVFGSSRERDNAGDAIYDSWSLRSISGIAPRAKLVSLKVLDENGRGPVSNLMAAIGYVLQVNDRWRHIHGVNLSVGYEFDAEWFACGQSPLCVEVNRLVRSGVVVVAAAGNTGYGTVLSDQGQSKTGLDLTINDPGNAELAITVGATHRSAPHIYGVSYFSSKGPTGDGRFKPDLVAPGEKVLSCAAGAKKVEIEKKLARAGAAHTTCHYRQESGTSMAAPHVSGAIAAFLSLRREFIGEPEKVKEIFLSTATDLKRERYFQGHGLVDLMRAIQSV